MRMWMIAVVVAVSGLAGVVNAQAKDAAAPEVAVRAESCVDTGPLVEADATRLRGRIIGAFSEMPCPAGKPRVRVLTPIERDNGILRIEVSLDDYHAIQARGIDETQLFDDAASYVSRTLGRMAKTSAETSVAEDSGKGPGPASSTPRPQLGVRPLVCPTIRSCEPMKQIKIAPGSIFYLPGTFAGGGAWGTFESLPVAFLFGPSVEVVLFDGRRIPATPLQVSESLGTVLSGGVLTRDQWYPAHLQAIDSATMDHRNFYFDVEIIALPE
ncbi:hypothetical protein HY480_03195 [Candidatus Uhrbacteria bacterium]|nr:hypothetical protein [Candidatus Uhrbacteria bacterium]